tara:strand:+ start:8996 stop:9256 length:261 start_codon:yes stop_codon:yes gene_type:complete
MGKLRIFTGTGENVSTSPTTNFVSGTAVGSANTVFASDIEVQNLREEAVLLKYLNPNTQDEHQHCIVIDGGNAFASNCDGFLGNIQ